MPVPAILNLTFEKWSVRAVIVDGEPWWVLADLCTVLEHSNPSSMAASLDDDEKGLSIVDTLGGSQQMVIVSEPGLYKLLQTSRKPQAKRFDRWIRHEVLPEIRKTGSYRGNMPTLTDIDKLFDKKLTPVIHNIANVQMEVAQLDNKVTLIYRRVDDIVPKREFSVEAKRQFRCIVDQKYDNDCPCCRQSKIEADGGEYDHYLGRELREPEHGWLTCRKCNQRMAHDALYKASRRPQFEVFQELRRQMFGDGHPLKPRKGSPRSPSSDQGDMFN